MIHVKDLRLNNWILDRGIPTQVSMLSIGVTFYSINGVNLDKKTGKVIDTGEDRFSPLPISPEVLEACGFTRDKDDNKFYGHSFQPIFHIFSGQYGFIGLPTYVTLKYLHQLQNIYHSLTEQELSYHPSTISEKTE